MSDCLNLTPLACLAASTDLLLHQLVRARPQLRPTDGPTIGWVLSTTLIGHDPLQRRDVRMRLDSNGRCKRSWRWRLFGGRALGACLLLCSLDTCATHRMLLRFVGTGDAHHMAPPLWCH